MDEALDILRGLNAVQALLNWLMGRGITRDRAMALIDNAAAEGRDLTTTEVQAELDLSGSELDETENLINST